MNPYRILDRKRCGETLSEEEILSLVRGAVDGSWSEAQLAAFLMAVAIQGFDSEETRALTLGMLESGEQWDLASEIPTLGDKHSTGGVGDKVSLPLSPILAACGQPVVMLTGRGLGHTGGTADKLEAIDGLELGLDRKRSLELLDSLGMAIGIATEGLAPADRRLYAIRDQTGTVSSIPLITGSILSKKLATGAAGLVFDVKTGNGAILSDYDEARRLAQNLVDISAALGRRASALLTDMSQPLGDWVGHSCEVRETVECLSGEGPDNLMEVVYRLGEELGRLTGSGITRQDMESSVASGKARELFERWVVAQGGTVESLSSTCSDLAPREVVVTARRSGVLAAVANRRLGLLVAEAGGGRVGPDGTIDFGVSFRYTARLGQSLERGDEIGRIYLRDTDEALISAFEGCFEIADAASAPELVSERILPSLP